MALTLDKVKKEQELEHDGEAFKKIVPFSEFAVFADGLDIDDTMTRTDILSLISEKAEAIVDKLAEEEAKAEAKRQRDRIAQFLGDRNDPNFQFGNQEYETIEDNNYQGALEYYKAQYGKQIEKMREFLMR